ncbi:MAG: tRNA (guanosine(37)-N1)-methyltransferase TrmD [Candidatus Margulisbacteria bacterium]|nr:tRNA (guanosine(37)-N1)-methyltransferase TrmD [Candidatus Margulisiibacteriota bacterium]
MKIDILTLFPGMFCGPFTESLLKKAQDKGLISINIVDIRDFTQDKHKTADDTPYGGGPGMVLKPEPVFRAIRSLSPSKSTRIILTTPAGKRLDQTMAAKLAEEKHLVVLCGHYEGIDERIREQFVTDEISIGDYVLTGGELPAMIIAECVCRLIPGVVKEEESLQRESFNNGLLDFPCYTRPEEFEGQRVPKDLLSGNHALIDRFRRKQMLKRTLFDRPEMLASADLTGEDRVILREILGE